MLLTDALKLGAKVLVAIDDIRKCLERQAIALERIADAQKDQAETLREQNETLEKIWQGLP